MTNLEKFRALMFALSVLDDAGLHDSPAADAICDASDGLWRVMSEAERESLRNTPVMAYKADSPSGDAKTPTVILCRPGELDMARRILGLETEGGESCQQQSE